MNAPVTFSHLTYLWPDGAVVLDDISGAFSGGRTGLVGANGAGKTTLLRLIAGELRAASGALTVAGEVAYLPQSVAASPPGRRTVADLLGVAPQLAALRAIEAGSVDQRDFDALGEAWDIEVRVDDVLRGLNAAGGTLAGITPERDAATLSGGEAMVVAVAGVRLRRASITLLDEPTNNLDEVLRRAVLTMVAAWPGTVVVVSHDAGLLGTMDEVAELFAGSFTTFGGPYSAWQEAVADEQAAAEQALTTAKQQVRVAKRQRIEVAERTTRALARGKAKVDGEGLDKGTQHFRRQVAENGAARSRGPAADRETRARDAVRQAEARVRTVDHIAIDLPDPGVPASRGIVRFDWADGGHVIVRGPQRVALTGRNGVGKTTLVERMLGLRMDVRVPAVSESFVTGTLLTDRVGYLPQRLDLLDDALSAVDNVLAHASAATSAQVRAGLARMLIRADAVFRPVGTLSDGERFRVALSCLLFATPPAQLLILDEPTNSLDRVSVDHLVEALCGYRGALLVVSHDRDFLARLGVDTRLELVADDPGTRLPRALRVG
jgi:ATPase subunit of ABC transporter with duplicated ATPase domains